MTSTSTKGREPSQPASADPEQPRNNGSLMPNAAFTVTAITAAVLFGYRTSRRVAGSIR